MVAVRHPDPDDGPHDRHGTGAPADVPGGGELPGVHRLSTSDYLALAGREGWPRTELLQGVIFDMPPESRLHALAVRAVYEALRRAYPDGQVLFAGTVDAGEHSMVEPDVYVERDPVATPADAYTSARALCLVVEVSVSTLARDLGAKLAVYAGAGIPEYWVVVPRGSTAYLLRHTEPEGTTYRRLARVELPGGVGALDVDAVRRG